MGGLGAFKTAMEFRTISEHIRQQILKLQNSDLLDTKNKLQFNYRVLGRFTSILLTETKCFDDNLNVSVTVLVILVTIHHPLMFYISVGHQHSKDVTKIENLSPTWSHQHHYHFDVLLKNARIAIRIEWFDANFSIIEILIQIKLKIESWLTWTS